MFNQFKARQTAAVFLTILLLLAGISCSNPVNNIEQSGQLEKNNSTSQWKAPGFSAAKQYKIEAVHSQKVLDVAEWGTHDGANIHQWSYVDSNNQKWKIISVGNNQYKIESVHSQKVLDVAEWGTHDGANIHQWSYGGGNNQKWKIISVGNNQYKIESVHSQKVLDVTNSSSNNGANIRQWTYNGGNNQKWKIIEVDGSNPGPNPGPVTPLKVNQGKLNKVLRGMSSHGLQWYGQFMNKNSIQWLRDDWKVNVVRAAMYTDPNADGYIKNRNLKNKVKEIVDAAINLNLYVIIDWHILHDNNPNTYKNEAIDFFKEMAQTYGNRPNVLYEICNEPNGNVNWNQHIRPYAMDVCNAIRQIDPDNVIIVGTGTWSQDIHHAANNQLPHKNIMYALHFYAGTHGQYLRDRINYAMNKGAAIFVSEWGTSDASGNGGPYPGKTQQWIDFMNQKQLSWCNWSLCDKNEASAALHPGANPQGGWKLSQLSQSGQFVRSKINP